MENYGLETGTQYKFSKIPEELRAIAKSLFSPQKEIVFRARKSLITDTRAGARKSPFIFVSVWLERNVKVATVPGLIPAFLRHSGILGAADEAALDSVHPGEKISVKI